jgi:hypothetical protein
MQDLAWDPWTWEVFCGQFTAGTIPPPRQTAVLTRCAPVGARRPDDRTDRARSDQSVVGSGARADKQSRILDPQLRLSAEDLITGLTPDLKSLSRPSWGAARGYPMGPVLARLIAASTSTTSSFCFDNQPNLLD